MLSDLCEKDDHGACFEDELDGCRCECHPTDCPAVESTGDGRAQDAAGCPSLAAPPASALPRGASAGPSTPARPSQDPHAGVDPNPSRPGRSQRGAGAGSTPGTAAVPGERTRGRTSGTRPGRDEPAFLPSRPGLRTYTIALPPGLKLLSLNGRGHWAARNRRTQEIKKAAWALARSQKIPPLNRVTVIVEYRPPDRRHRDAENTCIPSAKAAIDGIVQAGVLPDDECPRYVSAIACTIGEPYPKGQLVLYLIEAPPLVAADGAA